MIQYDQTGPEKAVLVGLNVNEDRTFDKAMREMNALAEADGIEICETFSQNLPKMVTGFYIGSGKIEEIRAYLSMAEDIRLVLTVSQLTPVQQRNLSAALGVAVMDRTALILDIFARRARTREAILQVEYARLQYKLPRLAGMHDELSRQGGASGAMSSKGAGEKKLELDRRYIERRMADLRKELETVSRERDVQRSRRLRSGLPRVALVGYTNAGKSTIMNAMIDAGGEEGGQKVFEEDMLFATLDTTVRKITPPSIDGDKAEVMPFLLSDTVGFIENLPTTLVKAFRSTLEETKYADLLLIVSDVSDPEYRENLSVTVSTLEEIGAGDIPRIFVFNKEDLLPDKVSSLISFPGIGESDGRITMSAKRKADVEKLMRLICRKINEGRISCEMLIPYTDGGALSRLMDGADVTILGYEADGTHIKAVLERADYQRFLRYVLPEA